VTISGSEMAHSQTDTLNIAFFYKHAHSYLNTSHLFIYQQYIFSGAAFSISVSHLLKSTNCFRAGVVALNGKSIIYYTNSCLFRGNIWFINVHHFMSY
jgi:hypothetical protein